MGAHIVSVGKYLPDTIVPNEELASKLGLTPEQIHKSSGILRRRWAARGTLTSELATKALSAALEKAGLDGEIIDYLLFGTMTPDRFIPGSGYAVQKNLGLREIPCLDIRATCCNSLFGLQLAKAFIGSKEFNNIAICLAEIQSPWLDMSPESGTTSMLFGDGASALIVSSQKRQGSLEIIDVMTAANGQYVDDLGVRCPGTEFGNEYLEGSNTEFLPRMDGQSVILNAARRIVSACQTVLERNELSISDIAWIVPHQANQNLLTHIGRSLKFPVEKIISVLEDYANTSSASMGIALESLCASGRVRSGDYILLPAFGAGFTWGAALCRA